MRPSHAAAHEHVEPDQATGGRDRQKAQVVGMHVAAVVVRESERDLELSRQVARPIDRLLLAITSRHFLPIEPDLVVRPRSRQEMVRQAAGDTQHVLPQAAG